MKRHTSRAEEAPSLLLAVQIGYSGTARAASTGVAEPEAFERALAARLLEEQSGLPDDLGLGPQHFVVGMSQKAIGADFAFTESASALGWANVPSCRNCALATSQPRRLHRRAETASPSIAYATGHHDEYVVSTASKAPEGPWACPLLCFLGWQSAQCRSLQRTMQSHVNTLSAKYVPFVTQQAKQLRQAATLRESAVLASETEMRLLTETVKWSSRRVYTGIA